VVFVAVGADPHDRVTVGEGAPQRAALTGGASAGLVHRRPRALAEIDNLIHQSLDPEPLAKRDREHDPGVGHDTLVIETDRQSVRRVVHHEGDLLCRTSQPLARPVLPAQEVI